MFSLREGRMPWPAIARELSVALFPDEDPGKFAAGLKEILAAGSAVEAARLLDELGFARLDTTVQEVVSAESIWQPRRANVARGRDCPGYARVVRIHRKRRTTFRLKTQSNDCLDRMLQSRRHLSLRRWSERPRAAMARMELTRHGGSAKGNGHPS